MLRISDFAQLSRVPPKALRLYDWLGLLKPIHVDQDKGYRFYSAAQLPRLNRILVLKSLGFPGANRPTAGRAADSRSHPGDAAAQYS